MDIKKISQARKALQAKFGQVLAGQPFQSSTEPGFKLEKGDRVIGKVLNESTRSLFALLSEGIELRKAFADIKLPGALGSQERINARQEVGRERSMLKNLNEAIKSCFWLGVEEENPAAADPDAHAGIRVGWQVVVGPECDCLKCSLGRILGVDGPEETVEALFDGDLSQEVIEKLPDEVKSVVKVTRRLPKNYRAQILSELKEALSGDGELHGITVVEMSVPR